MFPDPKKSDDDGLLCWGGELTTETLLEAYSRGVFPWPHEGLPLLWFSPKSRGVIDFKDVHVPKSLQKFISKNNFEIKLNKKFSEVIKTCAQVHATKHKGTWITQDMINAYITFHKAGYAHSLEVYGHNEFLGAIYGVFINGVFSAESMFGLKSNISKVALLKLIEHLKNLNLQWMDIQMVTPVTKSLGGKYITQDEFLLRLDRQRGNKLKFSK